MGKVAGIGRRASSTKAFWRRDAFWFVVMPTTLVALTFVVAIVARVAGA